MSIFQTAIPSVNADEAHRLLTEAFARVENAFKDFLILELLHKSIFFTTTLAPHASAGEAQSLEDSKKKSLVPW